MFNSIFKKSNPDTILNNNLNKGLSLEDLQVRKLYYIIPIKVNLFLVSLASAGIMSIIFMEAHNRHLNFLILSFSISLIFLPLISFIIVRRYDFLIRKKAHYIKIKKPASNLNPLAKQNFNSQVAAREFFFNAHK